MRNLVTSNTKIETSHERIIGSIGSGPDGPTVILLCGMHGNEVAGVRAVTNIIDTLKDIEADIRGSLLAIRANISALEKNVRYVDEDMNRIWFPSILDSIRSTPSHDLESSERREIKQLIKILDSVKEKSDSSVILADIHTFSAEGWMFSITSSEPRQRKLLSKLQVPMVFGIERSLRGTALGYYQQQGMISFGIEGGQHTNDLTEYNTTAALILLLQAVGCIEKEYVAEIQEYEDHLKSHTQKLPVETELVYQHIIEPGDNFEMRPGYKNFQPIKKGQWLANDKNGRITARCDGYMLMPLYQDQGNDGFFIIREHEG